MANRPPTNPKYETEPSPRVQFRSGANILPAGHLLQGRQRREGELRVQSRVGGVLEADAPHVAHAVWAKEEEGL